MWEVFERLCKEKGVTPYRVGEETGIKGSTFYGWRTGKYTPKQEKLQKIADYFGVSLEYLMTGEESEGYYVNPETARRAQVMYQRPELALLFEAAEDAPPEDIGEKYISVNKTFSVITGEIGDTKTDNSSRDVFIQPELRAAIEDYLLFRDELPPSPFFFPGKKGPLVYGSYDKFLRELSEKILGRRITPHALRHTCASLFLANGVSVDTISRRLGHSDSKITKEIYLHMTGKLKQADEIALSRTVILP